MRRLFLVIALTAAAHAARAGSRDERTLRSAAETLDRALERKDTVRLKEMLSPQLRYGHSNGWVETREDVVADLFNGKLTYHTIAWSGTPAVVLEGKTGLVRGDITVDILYNGQPLKMKLHVLQVWVYKKGGWILLGRQSVKAV
jgi:hypothetical protein